MSPTYEWEHQRPGERDRLDLMSQLLDPATEAALASIPVGPWWRCMELGAGNGSISRTLASRARDGLVVAADIDTSFLPVADDRLDVRRLDVTTADLGEDEFDLVVTRAMLHHLPSRRQVLSKMLRATRPGGYLFVEEPDFHPVSTTTGTLQEFWESFLKWSAEHEIDYFVGREIPGWLSGMGATVLECTGRTAVYNGGSPFAEYWKQSIAVVAESLVRDQALTADQIDGFMRDYDDPRLWTMSIQFTQTIARKAEAGNPLG